MYACPLDYFDEQILPLPHLPLQVSLKNVKVKVALDI